MGTVHPVMRRAVLGLAVAVCLLMTGSNAQADPGLDRAAWPNDDDIVATLTTTLNTVSDLAEGIGNLQGARSSSRDGATWAWPLAGPQTPLKPFDAPSKRWLPGHRGIDLAGFEGSTVRSVAAGVVSYSGEIDGVGIVSVLHPDGILSTYQPVLDPPARGSSVRRGQRLGSLGPQGSHCWPLNCLHLGARIGQDYIDPMLLLRAWEVSLLPNG